MAARAVKTIVILGGGVGGIVTARRLRSRLGREHRIVVVDREEQHLFAPSLIWLMVGRRRAQGIRRDLARLERKGIEVVHGEVTAIDPEQRRVTVAGQELDADYLVIALGADYAPELAPGLAEAGRNLYTLEGATAIRDGREHMNSGRLAVVIARLPFKCPAAPYEAAMMLEHDLRRRGVRGAVSMSMFSPEPGPMGVAGPDVSAAVRGMIEERGIDYRTQHVIERVDGDAGTLHFENGETAGFDHLVYVPPHVAPKPVVDAGLTNESGWAPVDRASMATRFPSVYAIGDVTVIPLSMGLPLPKAGTFASGQAEAVARTIAAEVRGRGDAGTFDGYGKCIIEVGGGRAAMGAGNFYAEPAPAVRLRGPGRYWHWGKVLFEKWWLRRWA